MAERSQALPADAWREITIAQARRPCLSVQRLNGCQGIQEAEVLRQVLWTRCLSPEPAAASSRYYLSNAPPDVVWRPPMSAAAHSGALKPNLEHQELCSLSLDHPWALASADIAMSLRWIRAFLLKALPG